MTAAALVAALRSRGVELVPAGDRLRFRPASKVPPELLARLRERKAEVLTLLAAPVRPGPASSESFGRLLAMPLDVFAREGQPIEVRVQWWPATFWFVPDVRHAEALCREGVARERLWTAAELVGLLSASPVTTEALLTLTRARAMFGGKVVEVRRR